MDSLEILTSYSRWDCLLADAEELQSSMQLRCQGSNNIHLGQIVTALCSAEALEKDGIS